jgi:hypothetical protein
MVDKREGKLANIDVDIRIFPMGLRRSPALDVLYLSGDGACRDPGATRQSEARPEALSTLFRKRHPTRKIRLRVRQNAAVLLFELGTVDIR